MCVNKHNFNIYLFKTTTTLLEPESFVKKIFFNEAFVLTDIKTYDKPTQMKSVLY